MRHRAAVLCAAAAVLAGTCTAVPAEAAAPLGAPPSPAPLGAPPSPAPHAGPAWRKCGTADYPTLQCASLTVPLDHGRPDGEKITLALSRVPHTARRSQGPCSSTPAGRAAADGPSPGSWRPRCRRRWPRSTT